jgi:hypothetical protein
VTTRAADLRKLCNLLSRQGAALADGSDPGHGADSVSALSERIEFGAEPLTEIERGLLSQAQALARRNLRLLEARLEGRNRALTLLAQLSGKADLTTYSRDGTRAGTPNGGGQLERRA